MAEIDTWRSILKDQCSNNLANFLTKMVNGQVVWDNKIVSFKDFVQLYKDKEVRKDLDARWRDKAGSYIHGGKKSGQRVAGKHEWIATNMFPYVLNHAAIWRDIRWIVAMEILRSPTRAIIFRGRVTKQVGKAINDDEFDDGPDFYTKAPKINPKGGLVASAVLDLHGHVGSLYAVVDGKIKARQEGMAWWHDHQRDILKQNLNRQVNDLEGFGHEMCWFIGSSVWSGSLEQLANFKQERKNFLETNKAKILCDYYQDRTGTPWVNKASATLEDMASTQVSEYVTMVGVFMNCLKALTTMESPDTVPDLSMDNGVSDADNSLPLDEESDSED